jgi:hypothetical protein
MFELSHPYSMGLETADVIAMVWQAARAKYRSLSDGGVLEFTNRSTERENRSANEGRIH